MKTINKSYRWIFHILIFSIYASKAFTQDTTPPVVTVPPMSKAVKCEGIDPTIAFTNWYNTAGGAQATDNSGTVLFVPNLQFNTALNILNNSKDTLCGNTKNVRLSWVATDPSSNITPPYFASFSVRDSLAPSIFLQPTSSSIECTASSQDSLIKWIKSQGGAKGIDVCSPTVKWVTYNYNTSTGLFGTDSIEKGPYPIIPSNPCNWSVSVSFKVIDECGLELISSIRKFEILDTKGPVFSATPANVTVQCSDIPPKPNITAVDACGGNVQVTFTETKTQNSDSTKCDHYNYSILRKWLAKDGCNNNVEHMQKITVVDDKPPVISGNASKTIECSNIITLDSLLTINKDNCSPVIVTFIDSLVSGLKCNSIVNRKYEAKDVCLNRSTFSQIITTIDKSAPAINVVAKNQGLDCNAISDINLAFTAWMNARGMSAASDKCNNGLNSFAAVPGSYNLKDTLTFPGTYPDQVDIANCDNQPKGFSRSEKVDFVYYDRCGNASVTSAFFGIVDNSAPIVTNCKKDIVKEVDAVDCSTQIDLEIPSAQDDCSQFSSPLVRFSTSTIKSTSPGNNEVIVDPVALKFGPYNSNAFTINGNATFNIDLLTTDADDVSEFFNVIDEDGNVIGKTNHTPKQCEDSKTSFAIDQAKVQSWISDGFINFTLVPNVGPQPVLSINDICQITSRANSSFTFPISNNNLIRTFYTETNSLDTVEITGLTTYSQRFNTGNYILKLIYKDCAKNVSECVTNLKVEDKVVPIILCPKDTVLILTQNDCLEEIAFPLKFSVMDNCQFPENYNAIAPLSTETQNITFKFIENGNIHVANNKVVTFNNTPLIKYADEDAELTVEVTGDFNNDKEFYYIVGEGGFPIGQTTVVNDTKCITASKKFTISKNLYNQWAADGKIDITAVANIEGNEELLSINPCIALSPSQTIDGVSKIVMQLITRMPKIVYTFDNGNINDIKPDSNSINIEASAGMHTLAFSTLDNTGNKGSCSVKLEVKDNIVPLAKCKNFIAKIHPSGLIDFEVKADSINNNSTDNCTIDSVWTNSNVFKCSDIGTEKNITLFVKDQYDNTSECSAKIKIEATVLKPTFTTGLCDGDTLRLFSNVPLPVDNNVFTFEWYKDNVLVSNNQDPVFPGTNSTFNGLYKVIARGFGNCTAEGLMTINIKPLSTPILTSTQDSYCDDEEILLKTDVFSGNVNYEWYEGFPPNGILVGNTTVPEFTITASASTHNYYVIGRSPECVSNPSLTKRIFVHKRPIVELLSYFLNVCEGNEIKLGTTTAGPNLKYSWKGPGFESTLQNPISIKNAQSVNQGKYQLVININECQSDTASTNVVIIPKPAQPILSGESTYCENSTFSIVVKNIPLQEKYTWIKDGLRYIVTKDNSLEIINVPTSASGAWQVVVESNNCPSDTSAIKIIDIDNLALVGASNNGPLCEGDTIALDATFVPNATYSWSGLGTFSAIGQSVKAPAKSGEYFVTITTTTGCKNIASTVVEVNQSPIITALSNNSTACVDGKTDVTFFPSVIPQGSFIYSWKKVSSTFTSSAVNPKISNVTEQNNGLYILTVINKNCTSKPDTSIVDVRMIPPKANFQIPSSICAGDTLKLNCTAIADSFYWHTPTGIFKTSAGSLSLPNIKKGNQGNYHLIVKQGRCESLDFNVAFLEVKDKPLAVAINGKNEICYGESIQLTTNNNSITGAIWTLPNGDKVSSIALPVANATNANNGSYTVNVIVNGCKADASNPFVLKVKDKIEAPKLLANKIEICSNENQLFDACIVPIEIGANYVWSNNVNAILASTKADCATFNTNDFAIGQNFLQVKAQKEGCESLIASPFQIDKNEAPNIKAMANIGEITACSADEIIELSADQKEPFVDVKWASLSPNISIFSPESDKTVVQKFQIGLNLVLLSYSKDGCNNFSTDTVKIFVFDAPSANDDIVEVTFNENKEFNVLLNDTIGQLYEIKIEEPKAGNLNGTNGTYIFEPQTGFAGNLNLAYSICIKGCQNLCDEAKVVLKIGNSINCVVPTIITPNSDGINDEFIIPCLNVGNYPNNELTLFNQWGDQVYTASPYNNTWAGTYGNDALPVGTYYYIFNPGNGANRLNGFFIIQR